MWRIRKRAAEGPIRRIELVKRARDGGSAGGRRAAGRGRRTAGWRPGCESGAEPGSGPKPEARRRRAACCGRVNAGWPRDASSRPCRGNAHSTRLIAALLTPSPSTSTRCLRADFGTRDTQKDAPGPNARWAHRLTVFHYLAQRKQWERRRLSSYRAF